jgi:hypothetical protein
MGLLSPLINIPYSLSPLITPTGFTWSLGLYNCIPVPFTSMVLVVIELVLRLAVNILFVDMLFVDMFDVVKLLLNILFADIVDVVKLLLNILFPTILLTFIS